MPETITPVPSEFSEYITIPLAGGGDGRPPKDQGEGRYGRGDTIDGYVIERLIAKHHLAEVYSARGPHHERVAIKIFFRSRNEAVEAFTTELNAAVMLHHPNVLEIVRVGPGANQFYLVMPLCEHGTLADWIRERPRVRFEDALVILHQLASALEYTHSKRIVHGDLSPENIAVFNSLLLQVKIFDFGLARLVGCPRYRLADFYGTLSYSAPERILGNTAASTAEDMFSLGAILYEIVADRPLFRVESTHWPIERSLASLKILDAVAPPQLSGVIRRLLSDEPEKRPTASAVLQTIDPLLTHSQSVPPRERQITK